MPRPKPQAAATTEEIITAVSGLSQADQVRLREYARLRVRIAGRSAEGAWRDLLHEAVQRLLDERRTWKKDVGFVITLIGIMRSISSNDWIAPFEREGKYVFRDADLPVDEKDPEAATEAASGGTPTAEQLLLDEERAAPYIAAEQALRTYFVGDQQALDVLDAVMMELTGPETKDLLDLSQTQLESIMRRIRRAAQKLFGSYEEIGKEFNSGPQTH